MLNYEFLLSTSKPVLACLSGKNVCRTWFLFESIRKSMRHQRQ